MYEGTVSEVNSSNSVTKVSVHMHGKFKTNTVTKHIRGEPFVTKSNKCHRITKFKRSLGNNCASQQPNQTKLPQEILNQFNDRSKVKQSVQIIDENSFVCSGITVQVNNFMEIMDQVDNFAGILVQIMVHSFAQG